jgi:hypothetical protein
VISEAPEQQSLFSFKQINLPDLNYYPSLHSNLQNNNNYLQGPYTEQTVFGARRNDLPINENAHHALKKYGFTKPDGQIDNPYKLDENLHFDESITFATG